jgi:hypothetical protein
MFKESQERFLQALCNVPLTLQRPNRRSMSKLKQNHTHGSKTLEVSGKKINTMPCCARLLQGVYMREVGRLGG